MKVGDLVKRRQPHRRLGSELGIIVGFEEGPIGAPYVRWFTNPHGDYVSLEEYCMVEVISEEG